MKCPLCDGTVVNGRCKECGMPYRNDEILYHLNESRSDHYRHASDKARKIMQTQSAGVGSPGKGSAGKAAGNRNTSSGRENSRTVSRQTHREQQREAMRKMTDTGNTARSTKRTVQKSWGTSKTTQNMSGGARPAKTRKHSKLGILWVIIIILAAVAPLAEDLGGVIKEAIQSEVENSSEIQTDTAETTDPGTYFYSWDDEQGYKDYSIGAGYGPAQAGVQFEAGKYGVFTSSAEVTLTITRKKADNEQYTLKDGEDTLFLTFEEGDTIQVESEESDFDSVYLMEWED